MIKTVVYKSVAEELRDQLDNENSKLHIYNKDDSEEIAEDKKLGTGMIIKLIKNDREYDRDLLVVKGDIDGNSKVTLADAIKAVNHYLENETLEGVWFEAGELTGDSKIKLNDAIKIVGIYLAD